MLEIKYKEINEGLKTKDFYLDRNKAFQVPWIPLPKQILQNPFGAKPSQPVS